MKVTKDKALIFSAAILIVFIIVTEIQIFVDKIPNEALIYSVFATFGLAETSLCAWIHNTKKKNQNEGNDDEEID